MNERLTPERCLPADRERAVLVGRVWLPDVVGPTLVSIREDEVYDLSAVAATAAQLVNIPDPLSAVRAAGPLRRIGALIDVLSNSGPDDRDGTRPWLLAPCDLQALKAAGVTFVASLLERVIEEQARGDAAGADALRVAILNVIGDSLHDVRPGTAEAQQLKGILIAQGV